MRLSARSAERPPQSLRRALAIWKGPRCLRYVPPVTDHVGRVAFSAPGAGEHLWFLGALVTIKVPGEAVDGQCAAIEFLMSHHTSPPRHTHPEDETFIMLDGEMTFVAGDQRFACGAGATWTVPRGIEHTFRVESETARVLVVSTPAGLDRMFRACAVPAARATLPPPDAPSQTLAAIEELLSLHRHDNVGPPMGPDD